MDNIHKSLNKYYAVIVLLFLILNPFTSIVLADDSVSQNPSIQTTEAPASTVSPEPAVTTPAITTPETPPSQTDTPTNLPPIEVSIPEKDPIVTPISGDPTTDTSSIDEGSKDDNKPKVDEDQNITDKTDNEATTENNVDSNVNTGENKANENDSDVLLNSGDAQIALSILNLINSTLMPLSQDGLKFVVKNSNGENGDIVIDPKTGNISSLDGGPMLLGNINNINNADLTNNVNLSGNTGNNNANENDGNTTINTGNVNLSLNLLNFLNSTFVIGSFGSIGIMNIFGDLNGNIVVPKTDEQSGNENNVSIFDKFKDIINLSNNATINNSITSDTNTGNNEANGNDGQTAINTGGISQLINTANFANFNLIGDTVYMAIINVLGKWNGQKLLAPIISFFTTGNSNSGEAQNEDEKVNTTIENTGVINNIISFFANTGNNTANNNDGTTQINTGNISIISNVLNFSNFNIIANKFVFMIINIFGDWNGKVTDIDVKPEETVKSVEAVNDVVVSKDFIRPQAMFASKVSNSEGPIVFGDTGSNTPSDPVNPFNFEKPKTTVLTSFLLDNINRIVSIGFLLYLVALVAYFARRKSRINS